ncbi:DNA mismatch repair protein MLH1 [Vitis vinifera]|uniref:DNA mismatch repair protein MLH1 n=1 Tax=Vitis vinifera TaxID=29760 RepID=A0A438DQU4_VITVI|nr:DNA mismatch repair protein MLH1 [Vitis vinifera]
MRFHSMRTTMEIQDALPRSRWIGGVFNVIQKLLSASGLGETMEPSSSGPKDTSKDSHCSPKLSGSRSQKVPVHKIVRTDSQDPAGRLHAYLQVKPQSHLGKESDLTVVR